MGHEVAFQKPAQVETAWADTSWTCAGIAAAVTAAKFQRTRMVQMPWVRWSNFGLSGISAAMFLFLCYNILAGGNPLKPPEDAQEEGDPQALPDRPLP